MHFLHDMLFENCRLLLLSGCANPEPSPPPKYCYVLRMATKHSKQDENLKICGMVTHINLLQKLGAILTPLPPVELYRWVE